jgi:hypothetical protein
MLPYVKDTLQEVPMTPASAAIPVKYASRAYLIEMVVTMGLYVLLVSVRPWLVDHAASFGLAVAARVAPALPIWLTFGAIWRYHRRIDELERLKLLRTLAIAFGLGSCLLVTYSFLEDAGLPALALTWAWPTLAVSWMLTGAILSIAEHHEK